MDIKPIRLYDYAPAIFTQIPSRKGIKKAIKRGEIIVSGKTSFDGYWLQPNDKIDLIDLELKPPKPFSLALEIVFEDDYLAIVNKPAGISTSGNQYRTVQNAVVNNLLQSTQTDALKWPKPVHRLDNQTSGLLIVAKTAKAVLNLGQQFEKKVVQKTYHAIVIGTPEQKGIISSPVLEKEALTEYNVIGTVKSVKNKTLSLVELSPKTGRTHQLRVYLSEMGFPILGDKLYGVEGLILKNKGLFLCSTKLQFTHPVLKEQLAISIELPNKFDSLLKREQKMWEKKHK
ncbi:MAG: RluA family pseudouridine synthase [Flavobacteriales bacterium]|nr:RluA family pseudouridine synthase [Flavobacteriales bacterium]